MRKVISILCIALMMVAGACNKENPLAPNGFDEYQNEAIIVGYFEGPECQEGFAINIVGDPRYTEIKWAKEIPSNVEITYVSIFPQKVVMNWQKDTTACGDKNNIIIKKIKKIE